MGKNTFTYMRLALVLLLYIQIVATYAAPHHLGGHRILANHDHTQHSHQKAFKVHQGYEPFDATDSEERNFDLVTFKNYLVSWSPNRDIIPAISYYRYFHCIDRIILYRSLLC